MVCSIGNTHDPDVIILLESGATAPQLQSDLEAKVDPGFFKPPSSERSQERFQCFCRNRALDLSEVHVSHRASFRTLQIGQHHCILGMVHLPDMRNNDLEERQASVHDLRSNMGIVGQEQGTDSFVLIGDFNLNPFDRPMNLASGFNAMMTRECTKRKTRTRGDNQHDFFYNPMWGLMGDLSSGPPGTVHDTSNKGPYGWSLLDQALIHHSLVGHFEKVEIIEESGTFRFVTPRGRPSESKASDHLPILLTLKENCND